MSAKHTEGPWVLGRKGRRDLNIMAGKHRVAVMGAAHTDIDWETQKANARLIIGAPELLAACKILVQVFRNPEACYSAKGKQDTIAKGLAAIRKAEGTA